MSVDPQKASVVIDLLETVTRRGALEKKEAAAILSNWIEEQKQNSNPPSPDPDNQPEEAATLGACQSLDQTLRRCSVQQSSIKSKPTPSSPLAPRKIEKSMSRQDEKSQAEAPAGQKLPKRKKSSEPIRSFINKLVPGSRNKRQCGLPTAAGPDNPTKSKKKPTAAKGQGAAILSTTPPPAPPPPPPPSPPPTKFLVGPPFVPTKTVTAPTPLLATSAPPASTFLGQLKPKATGASPPPAPPLPSSATLRLPPPAPPPPAPPPPPTPPRGTEAASALHVYALYDPTVAIDWPHSSVVQRKSFKEKLKTCNEEEEASKVEKEEASASIDTRDSGISHSDQ